MRWRWWVGFPAAVPVAVAANWTKDFPSWALVTGIALAVAVLPVVFTGDPSNDDVEGRA